MSDRYAREYLCPDPAEHGEIAYRPGILRYHWRQGRYEWIAMADVPICPICGAEMVHDTDDRHEKAAVRAVAAAGSAASARVTTGSPGAAVAAQSRPRASEGT